MEERTMTTNVNVKENKDDRAKAVFLLNELKKICKSHDICIDCPFYNVLSDNVDDDCVLRNILRYKPEHWKIKKLDLSVVDVKFDC